MKNNVSGDDLVVFLAVVRAGGFRAAARGLGMAVSKVSTTVSRLEAALGVPLLRRTTRSVRPTEAGQALADRIAPHLAGLDDACEAASGTSGLVRGRLRINVPGSVMPDILSGLLATFHERHPEVEAEVVVENGLVDIVAAGCDAGVRYGELVERDMVSIPIGPRTHQLALGASPAHVRTYGLPTRPEELTDHPAIRYRLPNGPLLPWRLEADRRWSNGLGRAATAPGARGQRHRHRARLCRGRHRCHRRLPQLDGCVVRGRDPGPVLPDWWPRMDGPRLYYPSRRASPPLRAFIEVCREPFAPRQP